MPRKNPSCRWFFKDWADDDALRLCSLAAQGLWMRMLCICAENDGHLLIGGKHPSPTTLARRISVDARRIPALVRELERNGVFSRDKNGVIYNRRMVRENGSNGAENVADSRAHDTPTHTPNAGARAQHDAHAHAHLSHAQEASYSLYFPPKSPQGDLDKNLNGEDRKKPPRTSAFNHNGVTEHRATYGPPQDPVELARKLGLPK